jgi:hypothetical protein
MKNLKNISRDSNMRNSAKEQNQSNSQDYGYHIANEVNILNHNTQNTADQTYNKMNPIFRGIDHETADMKSIQSNTPFSSKQMNLNHSLNLTTDAHMHEEETRN